jgi:glyoxylase-like metal-dependent hydrolase (beta-lactamase superfamily II)
VIPVTRVRQNCSLIWCRATMAGALVDPGGDLGLLLEAVAEEGVRVERLLITHGHPDHAGGAADLAALLGVPIEGPHRDERPLIERIDVLAKDHNFPGCKSFTPSRWLADGDLIQVGNQRLVALHCPGHTDGHIAYFSGESRLALVGDILFRGAVGYTRTPENYLELLRSIRCKLFPLGDDVVFIPGHERLSTFGEERLLNPSVSDLAAEEYQHLFAEPSV